jgi:hypothetical protein
VSLKIAASKLFDGVVPVYFWRALRTTSRLPEFVCQRGNFVVSKIVDMVPAGGLWIGVVFGGLTGAFVRFQVAGIIALFRNAVCVGAQFVYFCGLLLSGRMESACMVFRHNTLIRAREGPKSGWLTHPE